MKIINYEKIRNNLENISLNTILVLKDNCYGCGIKKILDIAYSLGFNYFAVNKISEAFIILNKYPSVHVLILGKEKIVSKKNIYLTVESIEDYNFVIKNNVKYHIKVKSKMNRFGVEDINEVFNESLCKGLYIHIGENNEEKIKDEINEFIFETRKYKNKLLHIGGSITLKYNNELVHRIGLSIYKDSISLYGKIIKIVNLKKYESIGYKSKYYAHKSELIGIVDVGYSSGLSRVNKKKYVYINNKKYNLVGFKCMDYSFVKIDEHVNLNDKVEFLGDNIKEDVLSKMENKTIYELLLSLK